MIQRTKSKHLCHNKPLISHNSFSQCRVYADRGTEVCVFFVNLGEVSVEGVGEGAGGEGGVAHGAPLEGVKLDVGGGDKEIDWRRKFVIIF